MVGDADLPLGWGQHAAADPQDPVVADLFDLAGSAEVVTLDLVSYNFGIQEYSPFNERTKAIFQGCPEMRDGYLWVSEKPGWGIEIDEKEAAKAPFTQSPLNGGWDEIRLRDGTVIKQ